MKKTEFDQKLKEMGVSLEENFALGEVYDAEGNFLYNQGIEINKIWGDDGAGGDKPFWLVEEFHPDHEDMVFEVEGDAYDYVYKRILDRLEKDQVFRPIKRVSEAPFLNNN